MREKRIASNRLHGSALVLVLLASVILAIAGIGVMSLGVRGRILAMRDAEQIQARCAADAGLTKAIYLMNEDLKEATWSESDLPLVQSEDLSNCDAIFKYTVNFDEDVAEADSYFVESVGIVGQTQKRVYATLKVQGPFESALVVRQTIVMKPGSVIDGYNFDDPDEKVRLATMSILPAQVTLGKDAIINGDVAVGVGGDPSKVICAPGASITGETYAMNEKIYLPEITVPEWLEDLASEGIINVPTVISDSAKCDGINIGKGGIIVIDGPVTLYVAGDISLSNSAQIQINQANPDASLTVFLGGNLYCKNGGAINNLTNDPTRLKLFGLDSCKNLSFAASGAFYGAIYARNAMVNLKNSVEIYGSIVCHCFNQALASNFHYDAALRSVGTSDPAVRLVINRWSE